MRRLWSLLILSMISLPLMGYEEDDCPEIDASQVDIIEPFLVEHRETPLPCKPGLTFSGNVRFGYKHLAERIGSRNILGRRSATFANPAGLAKAPVKVEFNLNFDYRTDSAWASVKLGYGYGAGVLSADTNRVALNRALFGYTFFENQWSNAVIEVGRKGLNEAFLSEVMFNSKMDGFYGRYQQAFPGVARATLGLAWFVADYRVNYWAYAYGLDLNELFCTGAYISGVMIDWYHGGQGPGRVPFPPDKDEPPITQVPGAKDNPKFSYITGQLLVGYKFPQVFLCNPVNVFGAVLYNWRARRNPVSPSRYPLGFYAGVELGKVRCPGDWSLKVQYQYVQPQAVFESDVAGITIGNNLRTSMYDQIGLNPPVISPLQANGPSNFKGWAIDAAYVPIDNLTLQLVAKAAKEAVAVVGGRHYYSVFELKSIYAF